MYKRADGMSSPFSLPPDPDIFTLPASVEPALSFWHCWIDPSVFGDDSALWTVTRLRPWELWKVGMRDNGGLPALRCSSPSSFFSNIAFSFSSSPIKCSADLKCTSSGSYSISWMQKHYIVGVYTCNVYVIYAQSLHFGTNSVFKVQTCR